MVKTNPSGVLVAAGVALVGVGLLVLMLVVVQARPAGATFPGPNGKIAYAADDGGSGGIDSALAAGVLAWAGLTLAPAVGAILMSASTIVVALNAQLLRRLDLRPT